MQEDSEEWRTSQDLKAIPQSERCRIVSNTGITEYKQENYEALVAWQQRTKP